MATRILPQATEGPFLRGLRSMASHVYTMYLFTARDVVTAIIPVTAFACVAGPVQSWTSLAHTIFWLMVQLLQCTVANQHHGVAEDTLNKPWRPIPSGRVSMATAWRLRVALPFVSLALSVPYGTQVMCTSLALSIVEVWNEELGGSLHWLGKTLAGDIEYTLFEIGACLIASDSARLDATAVKAIALAFAVVACTLHAADFQDVLGDRAQGRVTLPMAFPEASRVGFTLAMIGWSVYLSGERGWALGPVCRALFIAFGAWVGARLTYLRGEKADKTSYNLYDAWLMTAFMLPAQARWNVLAF